MFRLWGKHVIYFQIPRKYNKREGFSSFPLFFTPILHQYFMLSLPCHSRFFPYQLVEMYNLA